MTVNAETLLAVGKRESWFDGQRTCTGCEGRILYRKENPARIIVQHQKSCLAVRGVRRSRRRRKGTP